MQLINLLYAIRPIPHNENLPVPQPPEEWRIKRLLGQWTNCSVL